MEPKRKQSFLLRLPNSLRAQATEFACKEGTSLNHFISLAVAEKISRMEHAVPPALSAAPRNPERFHPYTNLHALPSARTA